MIGADWLLYLQVIWAVAPYVIPALAVVAGILWSMRPSRPIGLTVEEKQQRDQDDGLAGGIG